VIALFGVAIGIALVNRPQSALVRR